MEIYVEEWGDGPRVVLVHGNQTNGPTAWRRQRELADRWTLVVPSRRGYGPDSTLVVEDPEGDIDDVVALLGEGAHLVGHSVGGYVAFRAASLRPEGVRSLCLLEPATFALARGEPHLESFLEGLEAILQMSLPTARDYLIEYYRLLEIDTAAVPDPLPSDAERHIRLILSGPHFWDWELPTAAVASIPCPKFVVSGAHHKAYEVTSDATATAIGADRVTVSGAGHFIPLAPGCNDLLAQVWAT